MNLFEFINDLKSIVSIHDKSIDLDINVETLQYPKNFFLILNINEHINIDKYIEHEITSLGLEFCFHNKNEYKFLIKTDDWNSMFLASISSNKMRLTMLKLTLSVFIRSDSDNKLPEQVFLPFHYQVNNRC
jgi:hypothetical protein